jgi:hydroxyacylglutathione hydrolase
MSDQKAMMASLRRLMELPDKTRVFAGHMQPTTIGKERRSNPFVLQALGGG